VGTRSNDPTLTELANELRTITFDTVDNPVRQYDDELRDKRAAGCTPCCYYLLPNGRTFGVRIYLGGKYRRIGFSESEVVAAKFADLATFRFWGYRCRGGPAVTDAYVNFSVEDTKQDALDFEDAVWLLDRIAKHLETVGVLLNPATVESDRQLKKQQRAAARTIRGEMLYHFSEVCDKFDALNGRLRRIEERLNTVSIKTVHITDPDRTVAVGSLHPAPPLAPTPGYVTPYCEDDVARLTTSKPEIECVARANNVFELTPKHAEIQ